MGEDLRPAARVGIKDPAGGPGPAAPHALWLQLAWKNVDPPTNILI